MREYLVHLGHRIKYSMRNKRPFTGRGYLLRLAEKLISTPSRPMIIKTLYGFKMLIDPIKDKGVEKSIYYNGTYEAGTLHIFDHILNPGDVFIDVGSNIGLMTVFASKKVGISGEVHGFEPQPDTFRILKANCQINKTKNVRLNNFALGSEESESVIYDNFDINRGASSLVKKDIGVGKAVRVSTLENYLKLCGLNKIKLIKVDIEGYELEMLKGAASLLCSKTAPALCIEYSENVESTTPVEDIYEFILRINDYRVFKFKESKDAIGGLQEVLSKSQLPSHDNIFCFLPHHLDSANPEIFS